MEEAGFNESRFQYENYKTLKIKLKEKQGFFLALSLSQTQICEKGPE